MQGSRGLSHTAHCVSAGAGALAMLVLLLCIPDLSPETVSVASNLCPLFTTAISFPLLRSSPRQSYPTSPYSPPPRPHAARPSCVQISWFEVLFFPSQIKTIAHTLTSILILSPFLTA